MFLKQLAYSGVREILASVEIGFFQKDALDTGDSFFGYRPTAHGALLFRDDAGDTYSLLGIA